LAAKGNTKDQRNVGAQIGWLFAIVLAILISALQFVGFQAAAASFGLEEASLASLME
jgi:hypothetical protein